MARAVTSPAALAQYVHWNDIWFDRAQQDPAIQFFFIVIGDDRVVGCLAVGPHEKIDFEPSSRSEEIGEIYHMVIDQSFSRKGYARQAVARAVEHLQSVMPRMRAVRLGHHPDNEAAASLYTALGFNVVGEKIDAETGTRDVLLERPIVPTPPDSGPSARSNPRQP